MINSFFRCLVTLLLLWLVGLSSVLAMTGTIVLRSGEHVNNVHYTVDQRHNLVTHTVDGNSVSTSFGNIETIYDHDGHDITVDILTGRYVAGELEARQQWLETRHSVFGQGRPRPWPVAIRVGGNYTVPSGYFYGDYNPGFGFGVDLIIPLNSTFSLRGIVSKAGTQLSLDSYTDSGYTVLESNVVTSNWRYLLTVQYQKPYGGGGFERGYWFVYSGFGRTTHSETGSALIEDLATSELWELVPPPDESKFTMTLGVGGVKMFSKWTGVEFGGSMDLLFIGLPHEQSSGLVQHALNFDVHLGLVMTFGGHGGGD